MDEIERKRRFRLGEIEKTGENGEASVFGYVISVRAVGKNKIFMVIRQGEETAQVIVARGEAREAAARTEGSSETVTGRVYTPSDIDQIKNIAVESYVRVDGEVVATRNEIASCSIKKREIVLKRIEIVTEAEELPFQVKDANWKHSERENSSALPSVAYSRRLDYRGLDLRSEETRSIFRVYSTVLGMFREFLTSRGYLEIKTPKILGGSSEGGAEVFHVQYFKDKGTLAQSPQLYKQMAIIGGLESVYEIGPCFRAENSNTGRHLTEFTGMDMERELYDETYLDLVKEIYEMLKYVINGVQERNKRDLEIIKAITNSAVQTEVPDAPVIITFREGIDLLRESGRMCSYTEDIGTEDEKALGEIVKKRFNTDLFAVVEYPKSARPFYTSLCKTDREYTQSFDFILKGEEILSGAERVHRKEELVERLREKGVGLESVQDYVNAFSYGVPRHGGCGIGLERVVKLVTEAGDIHKCSMFPRDPGRLRP